MLLQHIPRLALRVVCLLLLAASTASAAVPENTAKALLVYHVIPFVVWPESARADAFKIGVLGSSPFNGALEEVMAGEKIGGRPVSFKRATTAAALLDCQLVVVNGDARESLPYILVTLHGRPVLTLGDEQDFAVNGGMVGLAVNEQHKLRLQVNLDAVRAAELKISAQLLRVADIVKGAPQ